MNMKLNKLSAVLLALGVLLSMTMTAFAHDVPDLDRLGSITVTTRRGGAVVKGGSLTIYRVGQIGEDDGNYFFLPTGDFAQCGESFETLNDAAGIARRLKAYAKKEKIAGMETKTIGSDGTVTFENLPLGLYLVCQHKAAPGYDYLAPFLVSLPYMEDGKYQYDLAALPKPDLEQEPDPTDPPPPTTEPDPTLPQTGQLWWPVPLLAAAGMTLFAAGWVLTRSKGQRDEG